MKRIKGKLPATFDMIDLGLLVFYVDLKITCDYK